MGAAGEYVDVCWLFLAIWRPPSNVIPPLCPALGGLASLRGVGGTVGVTFRSAGPEGLAPLVGSGYRSARPWGLAPLSSRGR